MHDGDAEGCAEKRDARPECKGRNPRLAGRGASSGAVAKENSCPEALELMEAVVGRENMWRALKRVESNEGAPGVDDMPVYELRGHLREHWLRR